MIDAQAIDCAVPHETQHAPMRVIEHFGQLYAEARQIVDVEEATVIDVVGGHAEIRDAPVLLLDQCIELTPARAVARPALEARQSAVKRLTRAGVVAHGFRAARPPTPPPPGPP